MKARTLDAELARKIDAYWRATNYLSVGQIYLCDNPLLKEPLTRAHIKGLLLGTGVHRPARASSTHI
jgi:xylulose-5-phosphate/fructose-6-phosphate phosphoketolase